mmetsp:Transcript_21029/g.29480  ORF Transcript_21029/g.29480 Transcript_21029/m.29480 type:complete len:167 (+) Transcript_21029:493-993(+)
MKVKDKKHQRKRDAKLSFLISKLTIPTSTFTAKTNKAEQDRDFNMRLMFSFTRDLLKTSDARKAFERTFMEEKRSHSDPEDIFCQKTLELCFEEVMHKILPKRAETWKLEFIKDPVYQRIMDASKDDQPWMREIISATKTLQTIKETRVAFQERHARPQGRSQEKN